ncbi:hypothetical protein EDC01DRAFT_43101 [Geopyxis carbonaria]|nr:hypothetical protein EDC01DRAFT_43101 [Geopyxis carbonaria]
MDRRARAAMALLQALWRGQGGDGGGLLVGERFLGCRLPGTLGSQGRELFGRAGLAGVLASRAWAVCNGRLLDDADACWMVIVVGDGRQG